MRFSRVKLPEGSIHAYTGGSNAAIQFDIPVSNKGAHILITNEGGTLPDGEDTEVTVGIYTDETGEEWSFCDTVQCDVLAAFVKKTIKDWGVS